MTQPRHRGRPTRGRIWWRDGVPYSDFSLNGKRIRRPLKARSTHEAELELREMMANESRDLVSTARGASTISIAAAVDLWCEREGRSATDRTRASRFVDWFGPKKTPSDVEPADVADWIEARARVRKPTTAIREANVVSAFFRWAARMRYVSSNPARDAPRPKAKSDSPPPMSPQELQALWAAVESHPMLRAAYHLALYGGFRREEIVRARVSDYCPRSGGILVRGTKTQRSHGTIPVLPELREFLDRWIADCDPQGFIVWSPGSAGRGITVSGLVSAIRRMRSQQVKNGVAPLPCLHRGRHTLATTMLRAGISTAVVATMLRDSEKMIIDVYGHVVAMDHADRVAGFRINTR